MARGLANARPPGSAKFANAPPPGLTRRANARSSPGGGWAQVELTDALDRPGQLLDGQIQLLLEAYAQNFPTWRKFKEIVGKKKIPLPD